MPFRTEKLEEEKTYLKGLDTYYQLAFPKKDAIIFSNKYNAVTGTSSGISPQQGKKVRTENFLDRLSVKTPRERKPEPPWWISKVYRLAPLQAP